MRTKWASLLFFVAASSGAQQITFFGTDLNTAQMKWSLAQELAADVMEKEDCIKAVEDAYHWEYPDAFLIPTTLIDDIYFGDPSPENPLGLIEWEDKIIDAAMTVCFRDSYHKEWVGFVIVPMDTLFVTPLEPLVHVLVHEGIHYIQCTSGNLVGMKERKADAQAEAIIETACKVK